MKGMERFLPAFAVGFAVYYALAFEYNWPMFTYFPAIDEWHWGLVLGSDDRGPPMHWYGWMAYAAVTGAVLGGLSLLLPSRQTENIWAVLCWAVPLGAILFLAYVERQFFL